MGDPEPRPADPNPPTDPAPEGKRVPLADWMAVWAEEDAREEARNKEEGAVEEDTHLLTPEQIWGAKPADPEPAPTPPILLPGAVASPTTSFNPANRPADVFDAALDGEIRRLLERTAQYSKRREVAPPEGVSAPGSSKSGLDFETPPGAWEATMGSPAEFDEVAGYADETAGRLGLLDPMDRAWHNPPTPVAGASRRKPSRPPLAPSFEAPSMTSPLPQAPASRKKPSTSPTPMAETTVAPIPWTDLPPPSKAAGERSTTRRMRETAKRVRAVLAPIAAVPATPWLTLGTVAVAAAWIAVAIAAGNGIFALVGMAFLVPLAFSAVAAASRGTR
ncbi:MAG: hypothetical protein K8T20_19185 [Planctomycetes bacterium]|nr:hypothetical protein [Planctomycetota bacterium]